MIIPLTVTGFTDEIEIPDPEVSILHEVILHRFKETYLELQRPIIVLLAAPPATGKSTLAALWEYLAGEESSYPRLQAVSIDGFHYPNSYLDEHTIERDGEEISLRSIKGGPETYDIASLLEKIGELRKTGSASWPYYDRNIHDPISDAVSVSSSIVVIEGNWVLLDEPGWGELSSSADITVFLEAEKHKLRDRLIGRKMRGGYSLEEAEAHYLRSDGKNIERVLQKRMPADITICLDTGLGYRRIKK